jgi:hypothetical protein
VIKIWALTNGITSKARINHRRYQELKRLETQAKKVAPHAARSPDSKTTPLLKAAHYMT